MPKNISETSEQVDEGSSAHSVLDFLYHDNRRIGSFLSQFEGDGHLQQLTRTKEGSRGKKESSSHDVKGNVGVASGKVQGGTETALEMAEGYARVFDPYWANARALLDYLSEHGMIQRDIENARIGQFALVTGSLIISDMKMLQSMWSLPAIQKVIANAVAAATAAEEPASGNRKERRANPVAKAKSPAISDELKMTMEILPLLPHSGHLHIVTDDLAVWATADEDSLVGRMSDLVLKHGAKIAGQWTMLGILDALPFETDQFPSALELIRAGATADENVAKAAIALAPTIRQAIGRPLMSYGMTPLLVFREVA